jgi:Zinc knuckle
MDNKRRRLEGAQTRQGPNRPRQPSHFNQTQYTPRPNVFAQDYYGPRPMELSAARQPEEAAAASASQPRPPPRGPLTQQERDYRRQNNLCLRCGQPGHFARDHPDHRPRFPPAGNAAPPAQGNRTYAAAAAAEASKDQA